MSLHDVNLVDRVLTVATSHHNLGDHAQALAGHLASALLEVLAGDSGRTDNSIHAVATDLRESGAAVLPPDHKPVP